MFHASLSVPEPQDQMTPLHTNLYLYWGWFLRRAGYNPTNTEVQYYLQSLYPESRFLDGLPPSLLLCCSSYPYYSARTSGSAQPAYSACVEGRMFHASLSVPEPQDQMTPLHTNLYLYWGWFLRRAGYNPTNTEVQYYLQSLYPESRFLDGLPPLCCSVAHHIRIIARERLAARNLPTQRAWRGACFMRACRYPNHKTK